MPVTCPHCQTLFPKSDAINSRHKAVCAGWAETKSSPKAPPCLCGHEATSLTQMKRHRATCPTWKARDRGEVQMARLATTLQRNHGEGVTRPRAVPGTEEKRRATLKEKYGAENVFAKESSLFEKVQAASAPHRPVLKGQDNPFSWPEVQEKIRQTNLARYGVENPQQAPEVRGKTRATNLDRYGVKEVLAAPEVRAQIEVTNQERYGGPAPSCSPDVVEKARQTNLARWGVEWTAQHPEVRQKQLDAMVERYGSHFFSSEEGKARLRTIFMEEYGVPHPMLVPEIAFRALSASSGSRRPNKLEARFASLNPELLYTGNGAFWRWLPKLGHHKNPDFILPGPDPEHPKKGVTHVVEVFGDFWHSRMFTGRANFDHEQELVEAYAEQGIKCLIVWESEFDTSPADVRQRVTAFTAL